MKKSAAGVLLALLLAACATVPVETAETVGWQERHAAGELAREQIRFAADPLPDAWTDVAVTTTPVPINDPVLESGDEGLVYVGGFAITSDFDRLHGLSDIVFLDSTRFVAVSDEGLLVRGRLALDVQVHPTGLTDMAVRPLLDPDGQPLIAKFVADAEGLAILANGDLAVSFERDHRIWRYDENTARYLGALPIPDFAFTENEGMEGIAAEGDVVWASGESGGLWRCQPACREVMAPPAVPPTDAELRVTSLDVDGRQGLYILRRAFDEATASTTITISHWSGSGEPDLYGTLRTPGTVDNFEGLAVVQGPNGPRLYILSDDNFSDRQRTLLLAFDVR